MLRLAVSALLLVFAAAPVAAGGGDLDDGSTARRRADVVVFVIDTLRADRVGAYGYARPTTPNIDALAARSIVFEQASAPAPWTLPSVVSLMTATFPCEHGVRVDGERLRDDIVPLAEHLRGAGYATTSFVANGYAGKTSGLDRGFDVHAVVPTITGETIRNWFVPDERPFLLYVHDVRPHDPYQASVRTIGEAEPVELSRRRRANQRLQRYRKLTKVDFDAGRAVGTTDNRKEQVEAMAWLAERRSLIETLYAAEVRAADQVVGEVVRELERLGRFRDTIFVLTSDHGDEFGDHGGWQHDQSLYEELIRVPLIVRLPGDELAGRRVTTPVALVDLAPTLSPYLDLPPMTSEPRASWLDGLAGQRDAAPSRLRVVAERHNEKKFFAPAVAARGNHNVAVRDGSWKAIFSVEHDTLELYDLSRDPHERRELSSREPERSEAMKRAAREWLAGCRASETPAPTGPIDPADRERLRALGYVD